MSGPDIPPTERAPERIWLEPDCGQDERCWHGQRPDDCDEEGCGAKAVEYIRADLAASLPRDEAPVGGGATYSEMELVRLVVPLEWEHDRYGHQPDDRFAYQLWPCRDPDDPDAVYWLRRAEGLWHHAPSLDAAKAAAQADFAARVLACLVPSPSPQPEARVREAARVLLDAMEDWDSDRAHALAIPAMNAIRSDRTCLDASAMCAALKAIVAALSVPRDDTPPEEAPHAD